MLDAYYKHQSFDRWMIGNESRKQVRKRSVKRDWLSYARHVKGSKKGVGPRVGWSIGLITTFPSTASSSCRPRTKLPRGAATDKTPPKTEYFNPRINRPVNDAMIFINIHGPPMRKRMHDLWSLIFARRHAHVPNLLRNIARRLLTLESLGFLNDRANTRKKFRILII